MPNRNLKLNVIIITTCFYKKINVKIKYKKNVDNKKTKLIYCVLFIQIIL